jgi:hypothetical protein
LVVASRVSSNILGPVTNDAIFVGARDLSAVDLATLQGLLGEPTLVQGECAAFANGVAPGDAFPADGLSGGQIAQQGAVTDAGALILGGATGVGRDILFDFDPNQQAYAGDQGNVDTLFTAGDSLTLSGAGAGVVDDIAGAVVFPTDVVLVGAPTITSGQDSSITWNVAADPAESVEIVVTGRELGDGLTHILCSTADDGEFTIPAAITGFLPSADFGSAISVARINGDPIGQDPDQIASELAGGKEVFVEALSAFVALVDIL